MSAHMSVVLCTADKLGLVSTKIEATKVTRKQKQGGKRQVGGTEQHANAKTTPTEGQHYMDKQAVLRVCVCSSVNMKDLSV